MPTASPRPSRARADAKPKAQKTSFCWRCNSTRSPTGSPVCLSEVTRWRRVCASSQGLASSGPHLELLRPPAGPGGGVKRRGKLGRRRCDTWASRRHLGFVRDSGAEPVRGCWFTHIPTDPERLRRHCPLRHSLQLFPLSFQSLNTSRAWSGSIWHQRETDSDSAEVIHDRLALKRSSMTPLCKISPGTGESVTRC